MLFRKFLLFAKIELLPENRNYKQSFLMLMAIQTWRVDRQWEKLPCRSTSGRDRSKTTCGRLVWPYPRRHDDHLCLRGPEIFLDQHWVVGLWPGEGLKKYLAKGPQARNVCWNCDKSRVTIFIVTRLFTQLRLAYGDKVRTQSDQEEHSTVSHMCVRDPWV